MLAFLCSRTATKMWTEALQAHFLRPERPAFGPTGLRGRTDGKLHCPWDNSRPSSEILPSHTQHNYSHLPNRQITVTAELHLQKNPLTVCAARLPHQLEAIVECTLKSRKIALKRWREKKAPCRTAMACNTKGVALQNVHALTFLLFCPRTQISYARSYEIPPAHKSRYSAGSRSNRKKKFSKWKSSMFQKGLVIKTTQINVRNHTEEALKTAETLNSTQSRLTDFFHLVPRRAASDSTVHFPYRYS